MTMTSQPLPAALSRRHRWALGRHAAGRS